MAYKLGSLFDGSGGFPLAGALCGIEPCWAAEVDPYPIAVTRSRFPNMKHLGSVTEVKGGEIEPVDIITFGSPCQDLSVAGKRAGLKHEANGDEETTRSGLFMEAVRIIKEMREATGGEFPRFALWENVPGAFSSQKGEDFRVVLEELIRVVEPDASVPPVPKAGWAYADSFVGDGWSLAYRVFDAQYWGVPQRRRRIHLVVDFRGERAREVLFEREGVRGYFTQGRTPWQGFASDAQDCAGAADREGEGGGAGGGLAGVIPYTLKIRSGCEGGGKGALIQEDKSATLATNSDRYLFQPVPNLLLDDQGGQQINVRTDGKSPTLRAETHGNLPCVVQAAGFKAGQSSGGIGWQDECAATLAAECSGTEPSVCIKAGGFCPEQSAKTRGIGWGEEMSPTLRAGVTPAVVAPIPIHDQMNNTLTAGDRHAVCYPQQAYDKFIEDEIGTTLKASGGSYGGGSETLICERTLILYIVRRLTPTECARLQGFADRWGDIDRKDSFTPEEYRFWLEVRNTHATINGKKVQDYTEAQMLTWYNKLHTDGAEYKLWGNGIALPPALYCMQGMTDALESGEEADEWLM